MKDESILNKQYENRKTLNDFQKNVDFIIFDSTNYKLSLLIFL